MTYRDPQEAFEYAIKAGRLSDQPQHENYAGRYMYMGTRDDGRDTFKHIDTRRYIT